MSEKDLREKVAAMVKPWISKQYYFTADERALDFADSILSLLREEGVLVEWKPIEDAPMPENALHTLPYLIGRAKPAIVGMGRTTKALGSDRTFIEPITVNINPFAPITHFAEMPRAPAPPLSALENPE